MADLITSRDNPWLKSLRRLAQDNQAYRKQGEVWFEGEHLVEACLRHSAAVRTLVCAESFWPHVPTLWQSLGQRQVVLPDVLFNAISGLESPAQVGVILALPQTSDIQPHVPTVVLDRVQDAGNVGAILRSAAAMGFQQVLALSGTAALWSPKVIRAGMGAHLSVQLFEGMGSADLNALQIPCLATSSHQGPLLHELWRQRHLPHPAAWLFGHEGQGFVQLMQQLPQERLSIAVSAQAAVECAIDITTA